MAFRKVENNELIYIFYKRETPQDMEQFKRELLNSTSILNHIKDMAIDFSGSTLISSPELGIIIRVLKTFQGTTRNLRLIIPAELQRLITSTNLLKLKNVFMYGDQREFFQSMQPKNV